MMYLASREGRDDLYPTDLGRRAMVDGANFYTLSILYPLLARATYPRLASPAIRARSRPRRRRIEDKEAARKSAEEAIPRILNVYRDFYGIGDGFIGGGDSPTIADIRLAATLGVPAVTDAELPDWAKDYIQRVESALGEAYSEPASDVRGYIAQVARERRRDVARPRGGGRSGAGSRTP